MVLISPVWMWGRLSYIDYGRPWCNIWFSGFLSEGGFYSLFGFHGIALYCDVKLNEDYFLCMVISESSKNKRHKIFDFAAWKFVCHVD